MTTAKQRAWQELGPTDRHVVLSWLGDPNYARPSQMAAAAVLAELCDEQERQEFEAWQRQRREGLDG